MICCILKKFFFALEDSLKIVVIALGRFLFIHSLTGCVHLYVNQKNGQNEIVFDRLWYPLSILLLAAIGAKLIGPHVSW